MIALLNIIFSFLSRFNNFLAKARPSPVLAPVIRMVRKPCVSPTPLERIGFVSNRSRSGLQLQTAHLWNDPGRCFDPDQPQPRQKIEARSPGKGKPYSRIDQTWRNLKRCSRVERPAR